MQQSLASWRGTHEERLRLLRRHILNVVGDISREIPLKDATHFIALGGDARFAASRILGDRRAEGAVRAIAREDFLSFCDLAAQDDVEALIDRWHLTQVDAETLVPALLAFREMLVMTSAAEILVPEASLRAGLLLDLALSGEGHGIEDYSRQVLASAGALGQKYRYDEPHARNVAALSVRLFEELQAEHGLAPRDRLLLEVAALLHDVGMYVGIRGHHKHSHYILSVSDLFGLSREDMAVVANVARYHRRSVPQKSHVPFMVLDRETRLKVNKLAAILRVANALDADHLQKVREVRVAKGEDSWSLEVEGVGDLTLERLATAALSDLFQEVFGRKLLFLAIGPRP
jgi:exopolyphosphatase/guanosine-5'-triphosphate,3'-diphosphate pyrophosphatase